MKSRPILFKPELLDLICQGKKTQTRRLDRRWLSLEVGDELWCKEKLMRQDADCHHSWAEYARDGGYVEPSPFRWKWQKSWLSPLHMPRAAARVFLEVVKKPRLEKVCDISTQDAMAEGFSGTYRFWDAWGSMHQDKDGMTDWEAEVVVITFKVREVEP